MKKLFSILNIVCIILTISFVSYAFLQNIQTGKEIYKPLYNFTTSDENESLVSDLESCANVTENVFQFSTLTTKQKTYLYELATTVEKLNSCEFSLATSLLFDNKKTIETNKILNGLNKLKNDRDNLIFKMRIYTTKMTGNTYGDSKGTYSIFIQDVLSYIKEYNDNLKLLNSYVQDNTNNKVPTKTNILELYSLVTDVLCNSFSDLNFENNSFDNIYYLNQRITFNGTNLSLSLSSFSNTANQFNNNYSHCDKNSLVMNFYSITNSHIDVTTEKDLNKLAFYYLQILTEVS